MKTLVVYFSYTAGNTKRIAEKVHEAVGGDIVRLEPAAPYPADYNTTVNQGQEETDRGYKPALKPLGVDVADYDRIIVGARDASASSTKPSSRQARRWGRWQTRPCSTPARNASIS